MLSLWPFPARPRPRVGRPVLPEYAALVCLIAIVCTLTPLLWLAYQFYRLTPSRPLRPRVR
jgi:hypothetical protein